MGGAFDKGKGRGRNVHLPVPHEYVTVAAKPAEAPIHVDVRAVGIKQAAMAKY
jgi:hypothetical protein